MLKLKTYFWKKIPIFSSNITLLLLVSKQYNSLQSMEILLQLNLYIVIELKMNKEFIGLMI